MKIDDYLLEELLGQVRLVAESQGKSVVDILVEKGVLTSRQVAKAKAEQFGAELVADHELENLELVIAKLPRTLTPQFLKSVRMVPIFIGDSEMVLVTADPTDLAAVDEIVYLIGERALISKVASEQAIKKALTKYFGLTEAEYTESFKEREFLFALDRI